MSEESQYRPVLILGASPRITIPVARCLAGHAIPVEVASFQPEEPDLGSRAISRFHRLPSRTKNPDAFAQSLFDLIRERKIDTVFAAGDPSLAALRDLYHELSPLVHMGCPPPQVVDRVLNKALTLEAARECGIRVPFTCTISGSEDLEAVSPQLRFPIVAKPRTKGAATFRAFYFNTVHELTDAVRVNPWGAVLLQEYCPGVGIGVEMLIDRGECLAKFQHRRLKEAPATGGVAVLAIAEEPDRDLLSASIDLLRKIEWEGVAMIEFRVDRETRSFALMEINGRFWGSVSFPLKAGVEFPYYYWQVLRGMQPDLPSHYQVGMRWRWSPGYADRFQSLLSRGGGRVGPKPSVVWELLRSAPDCSPLISEALWSWSDPRPFFSEWAGMIRTQAALVPKFIAGRLFSPKMKAYAGIYRRLAPEARPAYVSLRLGDALRPGSLNGHQKLVRPRSFLFVCFGNIMRSPMAEVMLKRALSGAENHSVVRSAGLHAVPGRLAHEWALTVSRELGMPLDSHRAQPVTPELVDSSDAVFAMDFENLAELGTRFPGARHKIMLLSCYAGGKRKNREVPDPYFGDLDTTRAVYALLQECIDNLAREIKPQAERPLREIVAGERMR